MASFPALARRSAGAAVALSVVLTALLPDWRPAYPTIFLCVAASFGAGLEISRLTSPSSSLLWRAAAATATALASAGFILLPGREALPLMLPGLAAALVLVLGGNPAGSLKWAAGFGWVAMLWAAGLGSIASLRMASHEPWLVLVPLACCWVGDSSAYFAGCAFGRHRLSPGISPAKSVEGLFAGLAGSIGAALVAGTVLGGLPAALMAVTGLVCGFACVFGDLLESAFKRDSGVKDSGVFLPGHGGVLDRTDSLVIAAPAALLLFRLWDLTP